MKILHAANFSLAKYAMVYYATDRKLSNGLIRNGHFVYDFSYRDVARTESPLHSKRFGTGRMNRRLIETAANLQPDLLLLGHTEIITPATLARIKRDHRGIRIALWYVDPLYNTGNLQHILNRLENLDAVFCTTDGDLLEQFRSTRNTVAYMPNPVDSSIETLRNDIKEDFDIDLLFCGRDKGEAERAQTLRRLQQGLRELRVTVCGALNQPLVFGAEYLALLDRSRMGLNLSRRNDVYRYSSDRIAQLTGNGLLTFTPETPGMRDLYRENEVVYFSGIDELIDKARHYHRHDDERRRTAAAGRARAHQCFNSTRVAKYLVEASFGMAYTEPYEWTR